MNQESDISQAKAYLAALRIAWPVPRLRALWIPGMTDYGRTSMTETGNVTVCFRADADVDHLIDSVRHEYAHARWMANHPYHDDEWGRYYADGYQLWEKWTMGEMK